MYNFRNYRKNTDVYLIALGIMFYLLLRYNSIFIFHNGLLVIFFIPFIILLSVNNGFFSKLFQNKMFVFLGEISYGIYILQKPVLVWLMGVNTKMNIKNQTALFYIYVTCLIIASALSYQYIETPLRNFIKKVKIKTTFGKLRFN